MDKDSIKVDCKEITKDGTLICNTDMKTATEMMKRDIKPEHTQINVIDKSLESTQSAVEKVSADGTQHTETDSSKKQECGCSKTAESSKNVNSEAKKPQKSGEN